MNREINSPLKNRILCIMAIFMGCLVSCYCFLNNFAIKSEVRTEDGLLGYYSSEAEFYTILNNYILTLELRPDETKTIEKEIYSKNIFVKNSYTKQFNNYSLIESQLVSNYTIYEVQIDDEFTIYLDKDAASDFITSYQTEWKNATIITTPMDVNNLEQLTPITELKETIQEVADIYKQASDSGLTAAQLISIQNEIEQNYRWPTDSTTITSRYGGRVLSGKYEFHNGTDIAVPLHTEVYSAGTGIITYAGYSGNYGYYIKIDHGNGIETAYAHNSRLLVHVGDRVIAGDLIAWSGSTGRSTGPHLHFEFILNGEKKDATIFFANILNKGG